MATLYPFGIRTAERLQAPPDPGETHLWLAQVAAGASRSCSPAACFKALRRICDAHVRHRRIPDREVEAAVDLAYSEGGNQHNYGRKPAAWPQADPAAIAAVLDQVDPLFDGTTSTGLRPQEVLDGLFDPGDLVCTGTTERPTVRPLEAVMADAHVLPFIVVNPMRGLLARNHNGDPSARCQANVRERRHLVAEFDDPNLSKNDQAKLATTLGQLAPLVMAVDSGGKSVHAWYRVDHLDAPAQASLFWRACLVGADRTRWDVCGWLRMPGGARTTDAGPVRQRILYWKGESRP